ncbi:hypothetical protein KXS11_00035 [Plantibacter flavus]|uniref:hypothetical protein n=1 Tax=Plantibacter flavus TaxID=150123 RepID=UPI003F1719EB
MTQLLVWILVCVALALILRNRPIVSVGLAISLWFLVPTVGGYVLTGQNAGPLAFHPATWLVVATVAMQIIHNGPRLGDVLAQHVLLFSGLAVVLVVAFLTTRLGNYGGGMNLLVDQILVPVVLFLLILESATRERLLALRNLLILLTSIAVAVAILQWSLKEPVVYAAGFESQYWFNPKHDRWMGTLDQPLALSLAVCVVTPLLSGLRHWWVRIPLLALMFAGALVSQSRLGLIVMIVAALYVIGMSTRSAGARIVGLVFAAAAIVAAALSPLATGVLGRVQDDTGSTRARVLALDFFAREWPDYFITGQGISSSYRIGSAAGLGTSLESSILMYSIDIGILFALLYFGTMVYLLVVARRTVTMPGIMLAGVLAVIIPQTYSALATRSVAGVLVWAVIGIATADASLGREQLLRTLPPRTVAARRAARRAAQRPSRVTLEV